MYAQLNTDTNAIVAPTTSQKKEKNPFYFKKEDFCLYQGDCLEVMSKLPENYVDMIFADPPYMLSNNGFTCQNGKMVSVNKGGWDKSKGVENDAAFHEAWLEQARRILKPSGTIWVSGTYHSIYQCGYTLQKLGYHILNDISWFKPNASPNLSCRFFTASHETIIWARKDKKAKHVFNYDLIKNSEWKEDFIKKPGLQMRSVWSIYPPKKEEKTFGKHPTQKPLELLRRIVLASTREGDIILDPFNGSGTTGLASKAYNRKYIGIEMDEKYLDLTIKRHNQMFDQRLI
jgi:site-specific DNA-methyltransferase (adenine-specific)